MTHCSSIWGLRASCHATDTRPKHRSLLMLMEKPRFMYVGRFSTAMLVYWKKKGGGSDIDVSFDPEIRGKYTGKSLSQWKVCNLFSNFVQYQSMVPLKKNTLFIYLILRIVSRTEANLLEIKRSFLDFKIPLAAENFRCVNSNFRFHF